MTSAQQDERCSYIPDAGAFTAAGGHTVNRYSSDEKAVVDLPASDIEKVQGARAGTTKSAVVTRCRHDERRRTVRVCLRNSDCQEARRSDRLDLDSLKSQPIWAGTVFESSLFLRRGSR